MIDAKRQTENEDIQIKRIFFEEICEKGLHNPQNSAIILSVADADVAQQVERILGKDEVTGSNPVISSN